MFVWKSSLVGLKYFCDTVFPIHPVQSQQECVTTLNCILDNCIFRYLHKIIRYRITPCLFQLKNVGYWKTYSIKFGYLYNFFMKIHDILPIHVFYFLLYNVHSKFRITRNNILKLFCYILLFLYILMKILLNLQLIFTLTINMINFNCINPQI